MKLKKFRIQNYKSFIDSGICNIEDGVTVFAGKNESGKTNVLNALEKINADKPSFSPDEYSFFSEESPVITYWFELSEAEIESLLAKFPMAELEKEIVVIVNEEGFEVEYTDIKIAEREQERIIKCIDAFSTLNITFPLEDSHLDIDQLLKGIKKTPDNWTAEQKNNYDFIITTLREEEEEENNLKNNVQDALLDLLPKLVVYKTLQDDIPDHFTQNDLNKVGIKRLDKYLGNNFSMVFAAKNDSQKQKGLVKKLSTNVSKEFATKYKQKEIELEFDINGLEMSLYIYDKNSENKGYPFYLSQRSTGLRWYLNFYIALKGEDLKDGDIILIDEPGLYLHPNAQQEMRSILNEESNRNQILYTTHSPYLIDTDNIGQIRLVEKKPEIKGVDYKEISIISNKVHHCDSIDTLRPIVDAIGYSLSSELNLRYNRILICEGVSDYFIIKALETLSNVPLNCGITHANGCNNIDKINSLYLGLGIDQTFALVDADRAGIKKRNDLIKNHIFEADHILLTAENEDADEEIEDIFDARYIMETFFDYTQEQLNNAKPKLSKEIKENQNAAKYTLAKQIYDKAKTGQLDVTKIYTEKAQRLYNRLIKMVKTNGND